VRPHRTHASNGSAALVPYLFLILIVLPNRALTLLDLITIECRTLDTADINATALDLAIRYQHHLFDTLYHAVALHTPGATLITADRRYYGKARDIGQINLLADWEQETP